MSQPPVVTTHEPHAVQPKGALRWVVAGLIGLLGVATVVASTSLGYWTSLGPGPGFFPFWLGVLLTVLSVAWVISELRPRQQVARADDFDPVDEVPEYSLPTVIAIVVSLVLLATALEVLGYQLSMFLFLLYHLLILGKRGVVLSVVLSAAGSFGVFTIFSRLLTVALPTSSIPFLEALGL